ncbi:MAG TPA: type II secretion system F family protein [Gemmatimonadota bacterium]|nr:type II secretion system F family protein [Gemmatimonadota bacterium]
MLYFVVGLVMMSAMALVYGLAQLAPARPRAISRRLDELESGATHYAVQRRRRQQRRERLQTVLETFGERVASRRKEWSSVQHMMVMAGYRRPKAVPLYFAIRTLLALGLAAGALFLGTVMGVGFGALALAIGGAGLFGWALPSYIVKRKIRSRQKEIQKALADALDLLVVCVEAGLGLNQALVRVSDEIEHVSTVMSEELVLTNFEIRAGTPRGDALRDLGERTGVADLKSLTAMLIQTDRFGTSIATALRVHSDTLRTKRRQRAEEAAAKTTIKLVFPLVLFIFPAMFVVILGPAILHIIDQMRGLT